MKPSKEMVQKYQQQQNNNNLFSNSKLNNDFIDKQHQHSTFNKFVAQTGPYSNLNTTNQLNSTNKMANIFQSNLNENHHGDALRSLISNTPHIACLLNMNNNSNGQFAFNQVNSLFNSSHISSKKPCFSAHNQFQNSMLNDSTITEYESCDDPNDEDCRDSGEMSSDDEQPIDFSNKSKKYNDDDDKKMESQNSFLSTNRSSDQVDSSYSMYLNSSSIHSNYSIYNPPNNDYFNQLNPAKLLNQPQSSGFSPFMNHQIVIGESQLNNSNLMHSEPSSPEGLSSASSTSSSRSSSQGYYSGSSFNGPINTINNLNVNGVSSLMKASKFPDTFNQLSNKSFNNSKSFLNQASAAGLSFNSESCYKAQNKSSFKKNSSNQQQSRPSVIVSNSATSSKFSRTMSNDRYSPNNESAVVRSKSNANDIEMSNVNNIVEEHFKKSLGFTYNEMLNSQSTPTKNALKNNSIKKSSSSDHDNFNRSLNNNTSVNESSTSAVEDHFAKSLGQAWFILKNKDKLES